MTLVLRYVDQHRLIDVADLRVTESVDEYATGHTDEAVKAFFARGLVVSYCRLDEIADARPTRAWVEEALVVAGDTESRTALARIVSAPPSIIAPPLRHDPLDIRLVGVAFCRRCLCNDDPGEQQRVVFADGLAAPGGLANDLHREPSPDTKRP